MTDIFAVQSEIATTAAQKLAGGLATPAATVTVAAGAGTKNLAAYDAYLRGRASEQGKGGEPTRAGKKGSGLRSQIDRVGWVRLAARHGEEAAIGVSRGDVPSPQSRELPVRRVRK